LPDWAVLALNPVGADRVRPMTGVVVSEEGLVIVPMDFAAPGDQIIVLDGGTDIIANGRAATIRQQIPEAGLTVLYAPALKREPARLSASLSDGDQVRLAAFPPAELIAQGASPVSEVAGLSVARVRAPDGGTTLAIKTDKLLPNVTGPLIDRCGHLAGFSSADGVQSMDTGKAPSYLWKDDLLRALQHLPLVLKQAPCTEDTVTPTAQDAIAPETAEKTEPQTDRDLPAGDTGLASVSDAEGSHLAPIGPGFPNAWRWTAILAVVVLASLVWWFVRKRFVKPFRGSPLPQSLVASAKSGPPREQAGHTGGAREKTDCVLEISGRLPDGTPFVRACDVNGAAIDVVIGRGQADIAIESEDVHREHVRLSGTRDALTISDLGSSRGTWINRVPCMKGEIMFTGAEDTIFLGDVSFQVKVRQKDGRDDGSDGD